MIGRNRRIAKCRAWTQFFSGMRMVQEMDVAKWMRGGAREEGKSPTVD
jgi:hypothetical protein